MPDSRTVRADVVDDTAEVTDPRDDAPRDDGLVRLAEVTGLDWSPLQYDDLEEVSGLLTAIEHFDDPEARHSLEELQETYASAHIPPSEQAAIGRLPAGQVVAYGWNLLSPSDVEVRRVFLTGGVHPGFRGRGIGRALLQWQMERGRRYDRATRREGYGPLQHTCFAEEDLGAHRELLAHAGFTPRRWSVDMSLIFGPALAEPTVPDGVDLVGFAPDDGDEVRRCHNECFAEKPGARPVDARTWQRSLDRSSFHPDWSWVARDRSSGRIIGYALNSGYESDWQAQGHSEGWTDFFGVLPSWRRRGVAVALLQRSMASFRRAGLDGAGLGVDFFDETSGRALYERVGYTAGRTTMLYALSEEPPITH